jgi:hypothetical protein
MHADTHSIGMSFSLNIQIVSGVLFSMLEKVRNKWYARFLEEGLICSGFSQKIDPK